MTDLKVGDRVKVVAVAENNFHALGAVGRIVEVVEPESDANIYFVQRDAPIVFKTPFFADELELLEPAPPADPRDAEVKKLQAQLRLTDHNTALHVEQYRQEHDNASMMYRALARHAPEALAELKPKLWQSTNEYDKLMSEASREREKRMRADWKLEDAETELAARRRANALAEAALTEAADIASKGLGEWVAIDEAQWPDYPELEAYNNIRLMCEEALAAMHAAVSDADVGGDAAAEGRAT